jgi:hypothetical protein
VRSEPELVEDFSKRLDPAGSELLKNHERYDWYNRLEFLKGANFAYEKNVSFTPGGDIQSDRRKCVGYGLGKNRCPSVVLRDSGNASDRCDKCSHLHSLHEQWIDRGKKRATS